MKKYVLIFIGTVFLSLNVRSEIVTGDKCGDNCTWTLDTETGQLTISGTGDMYSKYNNIARPYDESFEGNNGDHWRTNAPWWPYSTQISDIKIQSGITSIGGWAFYNTSVTSIDIPDTVTRISNESFQFSALQSITIPDSVSSIEWATFMGTSLTNFVIPDSITSIGGHAFDGVTTLTNLVIPETVTSIGVDALQSTTAQIYCYKDLDCRDKGSNNIVSYDKQGGVYILDYGTENEKYYISGSDMANGTECHKALGECKRDVLEAKGICQGSACDTFIQSDGNYMLKYNGKTYQSINDLLKGNYDKRRIYTIEEANFVAGDKNRVSIKYR